MLDAWVRRLLAAALFTLLPAGAEAQQPQRPDTARAPARLRVFIDCQAPYCDLDFIRTEITSVDYVRDRSDSHIHVLITAESTGGGGWAFTLAFMGQGALAGQEQTLTYTSRGGDTEDEIRTGVMRYIQLGLVRYLAATPMGERIRVSIAAADSAAATPPDPANDPWNLWSFRISASGRLNGEQASDGSGTSGSVSASRVTEMWKVNINGFGSYSESSFDVPLEDGTTETIRSFSSSYEGFALLVRSLGGRLATGVELSVRGSTRENQRLTARLAPAIEANFFPYGESTRRKLIARYTVGVTRYGYRDTTIYFKMDEALLNHSLLLGFSATQPWGSVNFSINANQAFGGDNIYRLVGGGFGEFRLFRGFSLTVNGSYARINDQIYLPKRGATPEDVLLQRRQLATNYEYFGSVGISYRFGSIFQNVVNPRFANDFFFCC